MELSRNDNSSQAPADRFTGDVYVNMLVAAPLPSHLMAAMVHFTPNARTNWHSHDTGQALHCTDGTGLVVNRDGTVLRISSGDTVWTPPGEEHWHGATADCVMSHLAMFEGSGGGEGATWLEPVSGADYRAANRS
jgi:quercetin dioxygenase-like cupin family protein